MKNEKELLEKNGLSVSGLVLGIVGVCLFWTPFLGQILGSLAIIFGAITRKRQYGVAGLVLGIVNLVLFTIMLVLPLIWVASTI